MEQGNCDAYSIARYARVLDLRQGPDQKLSEHFALGHCEFGYRLTVPGADALLGAGVTDAYKTLMRTPGSDAWVAGDGISAIVEGTATRAGASVGFHWQFRGSIRYEGCKLVVNGQDFSGTDFTSNQAQTYDIRVELERLFRDDLKSSARLRFDPFAGADADRDGLVTLDELDQVPLSELRAVGPYGLEPDPSELDAGGNESDSAPPMDPDAGGAHAIATLADYVYVALFPTVPRFRGEGTCTAMPEPMDGKGFD
jgi:hypothetical protein